jgi:hypothetical protein
VTAWPAIVSVPERAAPVLAPTAIVTVPLALPLAPDTIEIHEALLEPLHVHPPAVVTDTEVAVDPAAGMEITVGLKV